MDVLVVSIIVDKDVRFPEHCAKDCWHGFSGFLLAFRRRQSKSLFVSSFLETCWKHM